MRKNSRASSVTHNHRILPQIDLQKHQRTQTDSACISVIPLAYFSEHLVAVYEVGFWKQLGDKGHALERLALTHMDPVERRSRTPSLETFLGFSSTACPETTPNPAKHVTSAARELMEWSEVV